MTKKELIKIINNFVKLNPKKYVYPKINKYNPSVFSVIKDLLKNNLQLTKTSNYDKIFSNKDGIFLSGKKWIEILLTSKNINDYHTSLRHNFEICNQKKLLESISNDLFLIFYHDEKIVLIEATEINLDVSTRKKIEKIRIFLEQKDWSNYFFNLQKLMHEQIIELLKWKNKSLNYNIYIKKLNEIMVKVLGLEISKSCNLIIQDINFYRNILSKATYINQVDVDKWNNLNDIKKQAEALKLYFSLIQLICLFNLIKNKNTL